VKALVAIRSDPCNSRTDRKTVLSKR